MQARTQKIRPNSRLLISMMMAFIALMMSAPAYAGLFNSTELQAPLTPDASPKWRSVLNKISREETVWRSCDQDTRYCTSKDMQDWRAFMRSMRGIPPYQILQEVNRFANSWPYYTDWQVWRVEDYWASPSEFIPNSGDCEDYSIMKYITLKQLGIDPRIMRIVVVKDIVRNEAHAVLSVTLNNTNYILDSLFNEVQQDTMLYQYRPYYSVNEFSRWAHIPRRR